MYGKIIDQPIYIASLLKTDQDDNGNDRNFYDTPFSVICAVSPISGSQDLLAYGERVYKLYRTSLLNDVWNKRIKEGDLAYLEGATPMYEQINGSDANYRVISVRYGFLRMTIDFEKVV